MTGDYILNVNDEENIGTLILSSLGSLQPVISEK